MWNTAPGMNIKDLNSSPSDYFIYREQSRTFQDIGLYTGVSRNITGLAEPEHVSGLDVTDDVLPILGSRQFSDACSRGRMFPQSVRRR